MSAAHRPTDEAGPVLRFVRRLAPLTGEPDGELLARYALSRDEASFSELVRRHGAVVLAVCRRVLAHDADAEDAAQAVFLVLAQRAAKLAGQPTVGDWLHGVAVCTALKARSRRARRRAVEAAAARPGAVEPAPPDDAAARVDTAVRALPVRLRDAVVLCELEGVSRAEAAARLGVPLGTLASRLAAARGKLARRLAPMAPLLAAGALAPSVAAKLSQVAAGAVPAGVSVLALEVTRAMLFTKMKLAAVGLLLAAAVGTGVAVHATAQTAPDGSGGLPLGKAVKPAAAPPAAPDDEAAKLRQALTMKAEAAAGRAKEARADYAPLLGDWLLTGVTVGGAPGDAESPLYPTDLWLTGASRYVPTARFSFKTNDLGEGPNSRQESVRYVVNNRRTPHEFTVLAGLQPNDVGGRVISYIYEVSATALKLAYYDDPYCTDRPHGFAPKDQPPGSPTLVVLEYKLLARPEPRREGGGFGGPAAGGGVIRRGTTPPAGGFNPLNPGGGGRGGTTTTTRR